jgi:small nuclear ribonucleoprotein (snRNP)-like protein
MIDPEDIVTKTIEEDIVDEFTGMEEAMSKLSIGQVSSIPRPKSQATVQATSSEKSSQVKESDHDTADQTRRMEVDIVMSKAERESSNSMENMMPVSHNTASNNNGGNASWRNESIEDTNRQVSILTENVSEIRGTMTTMEEMMKLSIRQAQERETRMEEYMVLIVFLRIRIVLILIPVI